MHVYTYTVITNCLIGIMTAFIKELRSGKKKVTEVKVYLSVLMCILVESCKIVRQENRATHASRVLLAFLADWICRLRWLMGTVGTTGIG